LIVYGRKFWEDLPTSALILNRERLFQEGMMAHRDLLDQYELMPGLLLIDTTPEVRLDIAESWSKKMQDSRLSFMGLEAAIP
jgi:hypothetical protein